MRARLLVVLGTTILLTSCQPPTYSIIAQRQGDRLVFTARGDGSWPFRSDEGIEANQLMVRDGAGYVWAIARNYSPSECPRHGESPPFPIAYGDLPDCYRVLIAPVPLTEGVLYRVEGDGIRDGHGFFRRDGVPANLEYEDVAAEVRAWTELPYPRPADDQVSKSTAAAPAAAETNAVSANQP